MHSIHLPRSARPGRAAGEGMVRVQPPASRVTPLAPEKWPLWANVIRKFARKGDTGLGDTVVHLIGDARSERFKKWFARKFGRSCGCTERQAWLNRHYPYA